METVVNEFPPPPSYYKEFVSEDSFPLPPEIPSIVETYGGSLPIQPIDNEDQTTSHLLPKQLKQFEIYPLSHTLSLTNQSLL